jgi:hypothetical protein
LFSKTRPPARDVDHQARFQGSAHRSHGRAEARRPSYGGYRDSATIYFRT